MLQKCWMERNCYHHGAIKCSQTAWKTFRVCFRQNTDDAPASKRLQNTHGLFCVGSLDWRNTDFCQSFKSKASNWSGWKGVSIRCLLPFAFVREWSRLTCVSVILQCWVYLKQKGLLVCSIQISQHLFTNGKQRLFCQYKWTEIMSRPAAYLKCLLVCFCCLYVWCSFVLVPFFNGWVSGLENENKQCLLWWQV